MHVRSPLRQQLSTSTLRDFKCKLYILGIFVQQPPLCETPDGGVSAGCRVGAWLHQRPSLGSQRSCAGSAWAATWTCWMPQARSCVGRQRSSAPAAAPATLMLGAFVDPWSLRPCLSSCCQQAPQSAPDAEAMTTVRLAE